MSEIDWQASTVLVTGGTGSFGQKMIEILLREKRPLKLIVFSRDELKHHEMRQKFPDGPGSPIRYFIGDIRDRDRLNRAFNNVNIVIHAAAMKQVPACEYNPFEAVLTNIVGAKNVIDAAIDHQVSRVLAVSTDKAVAPVNLYGATKLVAEKLFTQGNAYVGNGPTRFASTRYGNVIGSRGSVVPLFKQQRAAGRVTLTDPQMTRFWLTLEQGVRFVLRCVEQMEGGEVFVPKLPSMRMDELANAVAPGCEREIVGIRPGEKLHEMLLSPDEARHTLEFDDMFMIVPEQEVESRHARVSARRLADGYTYSSDVNPAQLSAHELSVMLGE